MRVTVRSRVFIPSPVGIDGRVKPTDIGKGTCSVCTSSRADPASYCGRHENALKKILDAYPEWSRAYGNMQIEDYLRKLSNLPETGNGIKEVASFLGRNIGRWPK